MSALSRVMLALAVGLLAIAGCSPVTQEGVFSHYERQSAMSPPTVSLGDPKPVHELLEDRREYQASLKRTGMAVVNVSGVGRVLAQCPLQDLQSGEPVELQQNDDGMWTVMGRR